MLPYSVAILPSVEGGFVLKDPEYSEEGLQDLQLLAQLVFAEARGEPWQGQIAVAAVVLNRLCHPDFPKSIREIIFQPGQFEVVARGLLEQVPNNLAYEAALEALEGSDPTGGSLFFWNPAETPSASWVWSRAVRTVIGNHVFA
ncbi:MAG: cell wall hydrolase [Firmicutes bacterium]|nr:cell wall hydrolase [Bacillota bacterium]